jgi:hypothetical protein
MRSAVVCGHSLPAEQHLAKAFCRARVESCPGGRVPGRSGRDGGWRGRNPPGDHATFCISCHIDAPIALSRPFAAWHSW